MGRLQAIGTERPEGSGDDIRRICDDAVDAKERRPVSGSTPETISSEGPYDDRRRFGDRDRSDPGSGPRGLRTTALAAALSLVLAGGVATAAYRAIQSPADVTTMLPASTFAMMSIDLGLPGGQDEQLDAFLDHFPGSITRQDGSGSTVDRLLRDVFDDSADPHVDYDDEIGPWLGDHVAYAGWLDDGEPRAVGLIETTDEASARSHLHELTADHPIGLVVQDGFAVIADTEDLARAAVQAAAAHSLADDPDFTSDMDLLPDGEAAVGWLDGQGLKEVLSDVIDSPEQSGALGLFGLSGVDESAWTGRAAAGVHVTDDTAQLDVYQVGGKEGAIAASSRLTALPDKTVGAVEIAAPGPIVDGIVTAVKLVAPAMGGVTQDCATATAPSRIGALVGPGTPHRHRLLRQLREARRQAQQQDGGSSPYSSECHMTVPAQPTDPLDAFAEATGLTLPEDLKTLLGDASVISFGGVQIGALPDVAVRSHPDDLAAARAAADRLRSHVLEETGIDLAVEDVDGDLVIASSAAYAEAITAGGDLGDQPAARDALGDVPDEVSVAGFLDLSRLWPLALGQVGRDVPHLHSVGFWSTRDGSVTHSQIRLVVG
jgi:hypothetical protein